jgi:hypothetical protein
MRASCRSAHAWIALANAGARYGNGGLKIEVADLRAHAQELSCHVGIRQMSA